MVACWPIGKHDATVRRLGRRRCLAGRASVAPVAGSNCVRDGLVDHSIDVLSHFSGRSACLAIIVVVLINALITTLFGGKVHNIFSLINLRRDEAARYWSIFKLMYSMPDKSTELNALKAEATNLGGGAILRLRQLNLISAAAHDKP